MYNIVCRNCQEKSINDYYGFCSIFCFADFCSKTGLPAEVVKNLSFKESEVDLFISDARLSLKQLVATLERDIEHYKYKERFEADAHTAAMELNKKRIQHLEEENQTLTTERDRLQREVIDLRSALSAVKETGRFREMELK